MKLKKLTRIVLLSVLSILIVFFGLNLFFVAYRLFNKPYFISNKVETIEVVPIRFACDCADWLQTKDLPKDGAELDAHKCIFIEATDEKKKIPKDDHYQIASVRLRGRFYRDRGVSRDYQQKTDEQPDRARVFRYDSYEILEKMKREQPPADDAE